VLRAQHGIGGGHSCCLSPRWFAEAGDPNHIGIADRAQDINIVVAGGAGIHSLFVPTAFSHRPVTRKIVSKA